MTKRVLVTGATGYIGRTALLPLLERKFEVHATYKKRPLANVQGIAWHACDLLRPDQTARVVADIEPSYLLHFAWYVNPADYKTSQRNGAWKDASIGLLHAFGANGGTRAVLAGTCMEYDWTLPQESLSEKESPIDPQTPYGKAKNETRILAEQYANDADISLAWGRIFFSFGPFESPLRLVPSVILSLLDNKEALCTSGEQIRDFMYARDLGDAFVALLQSEITGAVNVASGEPLALKDLVGTIAGKLGKRDLLRLGAIEAPANEPTRLVADIQRLRKEVGWEPRSTLEQEIDETIEWWKAQKDSELPTGQANRE